MMPEQRMLSIEGHQLAVVEGNRHLPGPCVAFLHGILGSANFWPPLIPSEIRHTTRWLSISLPGHFPSQLPSDTTQLIGSDWARLLMQAITDCVGDTSVSLVGWSTGGFASLNLAASFPDRFERVMSIAGFAQGRWRGPLGALQKLAKGGAATRSLFRRAIQVAQATRFGYTRAHALCAFDRAAFAGSSIGQDALGAVFPDFRRHSPTSLCALFRGLRDLDITPMLQRIRCPVTLLAGDRDPIIRFEHSQSLHAAIKHSRLIELSGCGHMFFAERSAEFQQHLTNWFIQKARPRRAA